MGKYGGKSVGLVVLAMLVCLASVAALGAEVDRYAEVFDTSGDAGLLTVRFLRLASSSDEKPGDSTILTSPDGKVMVIDAGETTCGGQVVQALQAMGVTRIDYLVASHPHIDHVGGFPEVMRAFEIGAVYTSAVEYPTNTYKAYVEEIAAQGIPHVLLAEGDTLAFGERIEVEVLHPAAEIEYYEGYPDGSTQFVNDLSLVLKFTFGDSTVLFAGDLYTHGEKEVAAKHGDRLQADVVKINHHGDGTSSSKTWRDATSAKIAVAMHDGVADLGVLQKYSRESAVYLTFLDGNVKVSTSGDGTYDVLTQFEKEHAF